MQKGLENLTPGEIYVVRRIKEAVSIAKRLPPLVVPAYICIWPEIKRTAYERRHEMKVSKPLVLGVSQYEIGQLGEINSWMPQLEVLQRRLLWMRALGYTWEDLAKIFKRRKSAVKQEWIAALDRILRLIGKAHFSSEGKTPSRRNWGQLLRRQQWFRR